MLVRLIAFGALLLAGPAAAQQAVPVPCERVCMEDLASRFLEAMAARDASTLPLASGARYTENGQAMGFDNGLWQTASKVGAYRHVFADPATGQLGLFSTFLVMERGYERAAGFFIRKCTEPEATPRIVA